MKENEITFDYFIERIKKYIKNENEVNLIIKGYEYASLKHINKFRKSGDSYISHPLAVADILIDLNVDYVTIVAALLHETINHTDTSKEDIEKNFGDEIANIVDIISKINKLKLADDKESSAIYLRKVVVGLSEDVRVLFIKLADRLHNMRTVWALSPENQKEKANETLNVLIPIAHRLGINSIKSELEDLCLKYLKPEIYNDIIDDLNDKNGELNSVLDEMKNEICDILIDHNIKFEIKGRVKSVHSIYNKMQSGHKFKNIYDILALRILLEKESDCYLAIGLIHSKFKPLPNRFKDYISMPKENMYQSLHTTVFGVNGYFFEIQIRTFEMNEIAEHGIASHWSYKEHGSVKIQSLMEQKLEKFRNIIESEDENDNKELNDAINKEIFDKLIYVFTPKGDVIELPSDATPIDFAFKIHSQVGEKTIGAIVNNIIVPLSYELKDGDIVKIQTSKTSVPKKEWLKFVKTSQAKNKIKAYFSKQDREIYVIKGKNIFEKELRRRKLSFEDVLNEENVSILIKILKVDNLEEIYFSVGSLRYTPSSILNLINNKDSSKEAVVDKLLNQNKVITKSLVSDVLVEGTSDIKVNLSKCCKPVMGDDIVGYVTKGNGISVHRKTCDNLKNVNDRLIEVNWNTQVKNDYYTDLIIKTNRDNNPLLDIIRSFSSNEIFILSIKNFKLDSNDNYEITIRVNNLDKLNNIINEINKLSFVISVERN